MIYEEEAKNELKVEEHITYIEDDGRRQMRQRESQVNYA